LLLGKIENGEGLVKFRQLISQQGGDQAVIDDYSLFPKTNYQIDVKSDEKGYVNAMDTREIGLAAVELGAGREKLDSDVDLDVAILIKKKIGDPVKKNEDLAKILANDFEKGKRAEQRIKKAYGITRHKTRRLKKVLFLVDEKGIRELPTG